MANPHPSPAEPSELFSKTNSSGDPRRTQVRYAILAATTLAAFMMYIDRACLAWIIDSDSFKSQIQLEKHQADWLKSAFFWVYALAQVPAGWLAERFGKRLLMSVLILTWSAFTALTSFADGFGMLLLARIGCGLAQAGAYPIAGSLLSRWANINYRGFASSIVSLGGRLGFVLAPIITVFVISTSGSWRAAGWIYGAAGIGVAALFWIVFRERPEDHPWASQSERDYLAEGRVPDRGNAIKGFPLMAVLTDTSVWLMCGVQFLTNYGWVFVLNSMAGYLKDVKHVSDVQNGIISTVALFIGFFGLLIGGVVIDACSRRFGIRLGRMIPLAATRFLAAAMLLCCLPEQSAWMIAIWLGLMTFATDAGIPAMWAWAQDVGGRQVAPILGWANMWGNFGAALQPLMNGWIVANLDSNKDYQESFIACAAAFALSGFLSLGINAAKPVAAET